MLGFAEPSTWIPTHSTAEAASEDAPPVPSRSESANKAVLFGLLAFASFSTHDVFVKHLGATYSPFQILFFSALLSFPLITLVMIRDSKPGTLIPVHPFWVALRSISGSTAALCSFYAFSNLPLSQAYAFIFATPLVITVLAIPLLGETVRLRRGLAVIVGLLGVLIVLRPGASPLESGHIAALGAAFFGALNSLIVRKIGSRERGVIMILYPMLCNLAVSATILPFVYVEVPIGDLGLFAVLSAIVLVAMGLLVAAYSRASAIVVSPTQYSQIIWAALFGALLFDEYPDGQTYLGTAVIVLSGIYILKREATSDVSTNAPVLNTRTRTGHAAGLRVGQLMRRFRHKE
jgi:drug/metabolite transporter (DMT)-like permease